ADERGRAADQPEDAEEGPTRRLLLAGERGDDPEALGRVVQTEADDQRDRERELVRRGGLADREPLGEVVQADPYGDEDREPARRRHRRVQVALLLELGDRGGARAQERAVPPSLELHVVEGEAEEPDREADRQERGEEREAPVM